MRRSFAITWSVLPVGLLLLALAGTTAAQQPWGNPPPPPPGRTLSGTWYMNGNPNQPTQIRQRGPDRALFTNENGSQAWGTIRGDRVWIPDWSDGSSQGLSGRIRGDRILWPGSYWSRFPE